MLYKDDKSTVFSIVPFAISEFKPGLYPGSFFIPACLDDSKPERLVVHASEHLMAVGGKKQPIRIETASYQIAKAVVDDFLDGQLFAAPDAHPGICWMQGDIPMTRIIGSPEHNLMKSLQRKWFVLVVQKTEDDWKKYKNSRVVTDHARFAVRALGLPMPEWMSTEEIGMNFNKCPACGTMNDRENAVCSNCRCVLNEEKFKLLHFAASVK